MNTEIAFESLKTSLLANKLFNSTFKGTRFYDASSEFPRSVTAFYENYIAAGEVTVYIIPEHSYCEYELLVFKGELFFCENEKFQSKEELEKIIEKFGDFIANKGA